MKVDRLALMETFLRIVDAGNLSAAATQLGTTQPTVSRRLRALEGSLGITLLKRSTHAIQLTDAGERYVARARELLADWRGFEEELRGEEDEPEGTLRVVVPHAFGQRELVGPVVEYLRRYPGTTVEWVLSDAPVRLVEDGVDCLIRVGTLDSDTLVARKIHEVKRIVVAAPSVVPKTVTRPSQLAALPWLALRTFYRTRVRLEGERGPVSFAIRPRFVTDSLFALRNATLAGLGAAIVSEWIVRDDITEGRLVHLLPRFHAPSLPVYVAYPKARVQPAKLRRFVELARRAFDGVR